MVGKKSYFTTFKLIIALIYLHYQVLQHSKHHLFNSYYFRQRSEDFDLLENDLLRYSNPLQFKFNFKDIFVIIIDIYEHIKHLFYFYFQFIL